MKSQVDTQKAKHEHRVFFVSLAVFGLTLLLAVPVSAMPLGVTHPAAQLWGCENSSTGTSPCNGLDGGSHKFGWSSSGNLGNDSLYVEGNTVPWRIELDEMDPNATIVLTWTYSFVNGGAYTWDYMRSWNATVIANGANGGNPCDGLPAPIGGSSCTDANAHSTFAIPHDPMLHNGNTGPNCPPAPPGNATFGPVPGNMLGYGPITITAINYVGTTPGCLTTSPNNDRQVAITFQTGAANNTSTTPNSVNGVLVVGLHTGRPGDWGPFPCTTGAGGTCQTASSLGGGQSSAYHASLVSWFETAGPSGGGFQGVGALPGLQTTQRQMKINAVSGPTAVTLSKFGVLQVVPAHVTLSWTTASEVNTAGFNLYRSENPNGPFTRINPQLIAASIDPVAGGKYQYQDTSIVSGRTYYYQLEDVELNGKSTRHDPIVVNAPSTSFAVDGNLPIALVASLGAFILIGGGLFVTLKKLNVL